MPRTKQKRPIIVRSGVTIPVVRSVVVRDSDKDIPENKQVGICSVNNLLCQVEPALHL